MKPGILVVGDQIFHGSLFGAEWGAQKAESVATDRNPHGEVVFNTSMTGYQEVLTDPSYAGQMIVFTTAHIGNTGANLEDLESPRIYAKAVVMGRYTEKPSNFRSKKTLEQFLKEQNTVGICGIDTRALTLYLRTKGVAPGMILPASEEKNLAEWKKKWMDLDYGSIDWIKAVSAREPYSFHAKEVTATKKYKVVVYDYGVKRQLLVDLEKRGCDLTVVPADFPADKVLAMKPDGVFLSNGPGDPKLATYAVTAVKNLLGKKPIFGVCMGHQVLGMALGAKTYKLKFGHRGGNQPVKNMASGSVEISSHNHGYAVDTSTLPKTAMLTHQNLNDECCEGLSAPSLNAFSVQYHPESSPGPHDSAYLFDQFIAQMHHN